MKREQLRQHAIKYLAELKRKKKPFRFSNAKFEKYFMHDQSRIFINYGSRGSAKTHSIVQKMLFLCEQSYYFRGLVLRKRFNTHRTTCWPLFIDIINSTCRQDLYKINKSEFKITNKKTGNSIFLKGLDDPEKIKGFANPTYVWFEEPNTDGVTAKDFDTVQTTMRGTGYFYMQTVLSFNSDDAESWIKKRFFPKGLAFESELPDNPIVKSPIEGVTILHSTYKDNIFIDEDSINAYEGLKEHDPELHRVYAKGLFGGKVKGKVFENYEVIDNYESKNGYTCYAIDWGWNDPTVVIECKLVNGELYFKELFYKSNIQVQSDLIPYLHEVIKSRKPVLYCDSSRPSDIKLLKTNGLNAVKSDKNIKQGISRLKAYPKFYIDNSSVNMKKELDYYKWKYNAKYDIFLDEPVDGFDHTIDCIRYAVNSDPYIKADMDRRGLSRLMRK